MKRDVGDVAVAVGQVSHVAAATAAGPLPQKLRLLLVDDERAILDGLALHLRRKYDIVMRTSAAAGLEALAEGSAFSAVISDLKMPFMDGIQFLSEVRQRSPGTTRVLLTGYADVRSAIAAVNDAGVHCFLTKPCPPAELALALEEALASTAGARNVTVDEQLARLGRQATLGTMAGAIGSEIGNLVSALSSSLDLVQSQVEHSEVPASETVGVMVMLKNRLREHTFTLLDLSRPRRMKVEVLDVGTIVCGSVAMLKKSGVIKGMKTEIDLPSMALHIEADRALIEGVLINLVKNATEALAEKAQAASGASCDADLEAPLIAIGVKPSGDQAVAITVTDNGPGILPENIEHLFATYFTTKAGSGGTGFGLAIARETIEHHGGYIDVASKLGEGTTFTIELPLAGCRRLTKANPASREGGSPLRLVTRER